MPRSLRPLLLVWMLAYPILPLAPLFGVLIAIAAGPPFVLGFDEAGWPVFGTITPWFLAVTVGVPWVGGAALIFVAGVLLERRR